MKVDTKEIGFVKSVKNFLIYIDGLPSVRINDLLRSEEGVTAMVTALLPTEVEAWVLSPGKVRPGQTFSAETQKLSILIGEHLLGRAINPLGLLVDEKKQKNNAAPSGEVMEIEREALGISARQFITEQFVTGLSTIDLLVPIGKGQRELVVGDARSGKTAFVLDTIVNQKDKDVICVYALIGRSMAAVKSTMQILEEKGGLAHTVIVAGFSNDPLPLIFLTSKTAMTVAEYFRNKGKDVLLIMDDMGAHAKVYREISLLSNRFPGREAYPGDIFFQHASLLERAGNFSEVAGGGSITALPIIELDLNDFSSFIPTNLMSMTDGHLLFKSSIYNQGRRPAVDITLSVSRVGRQTQNGVQNRLATRVKQTLAAAEQLGSVTGFGGELPASTQLLLRQKGVIEELLSQPAWDSLTPAEQIVMLSLPYINFFADKDADFIVQNRGQLVAALRNNEEFKKLVEATVKQFKTDVELVEKLNTMDNAFRKLLGNSAGAVQVVDPISWLPSI